jgi:hypothetical protein
MNGNAWMADDVTWPGARDRRTFLEWFELDSCIVVLDLTE